jgi:hypothetical protein
MSRRTEYHRGYYWANVESRRKAARDSRKRRRLVKALCDGIDEAKNDKAHQAFMVGLDAAGWQPVRFRWGSACSGRYWTSLDLSTPLNTPIPSGTLVGETTHRATLNLDRGSQPLGARRIVGKRKWHSRG